VTALASFNEFCDLTEIVMRAKQELGNILSIAEVLDRQAYDLATNGKGDLQVFDEHPRNFIFILEVEQYDTIENTTKSVTNFFK